MNLGRALIPDFAVLQAFESAARHGSFTRAAAELSLTQSAISRQIRALEEQLGVNLFERVRKRVVLSASGRALLPDVSRMLGQIEEVVLRAMASSDGTSALSVAALPTFASRWLLPRLPDFTRRHPRVALNIASRSEPFDMTADGFDVAIHYGQPIWAHATCTYLCSEIIVPVASPALIASDAIVAPQDLEHRPLLHLATRPKLWAEWFEKNGNGWTNAYHGHRFDQFNMIIEAAVAGLGFALLPKYLIEQELASAALQIALDRPMSTNNSYYVVLPEGRQETPMALEFQDWLIRQVTAQPASALNL